MAAFFVNNQQHKGEKVLGTMSSHTTLRISNVYCKHIAGIIVQSSRLTVALWMYHRPTGLGAPPPPPPPASYAYD